MNRVSLAAFARARRTPAALLLLTALAAGLRFWGLDRIPPGFHYDEAYEALEAWRLLTQPGYHPLFFPGNFGVEPMFIYLTSLAFWLFGESPAVMRGVAATIGTLTVPALYALGRELVRADDSMPRFSGHRIPPALPLLAAASLAIMRWHLHFSRVGIEPVLVPFFLVLILWLLFRALRTNGIGAWLALGVAVGLSPYTYTAGRLLPVVAAALVVWRIVWGDKETRKQGNKETSRQVDKAHAPTPPLPHSPAPPLPRPSAPPLLRALLASAVALVVFAPLGLNWLQHPDQLLLRSSQIAVGAEGAGPGSPARNLVSTLGMFSFRGDADARNNLPGLPVLDVLMSLPLYLGAGLTLWRWRRPAFGGLLLAGAIMLAPTVLSEYAPHFRRALGAAPVVALLCGLGLVLMLGRSSAGLEALAGVAVNGRNRLKPRVQNSGRPGFEALAGLVGKARNRLKPLVRSGGQLFPEPPAPPVQAIPWRLQQSGIAPDELAERMDALRGLGRTIVVAVILLGSAVYAATAYFGAWGLSHAIYYAYDQGLWEIGQYVLGLPADERVYLTPRPAGDMTLAFAWREGRAVRHFDGRSALVAPAYAPGTATYIVIEHEDFRGGRLLLELYPRATEVKVFLDRDGKVYARAYQISDTSISNTGRQPKHAFTSGWPGMALVGYDLDRPAYRPGDIVYLQLWWRATATVPADWTVFTHLLGPPKADGSIVWAGRDARPGQGSAPTTAWQPGDLILDEYQLQLPADAPPGSYRIEVGLYDPATGGARAVTSDPPGQDHLVLGAVMVR